MNPAVASVENGRYKTEAVGPDHLDTSTKAEEPGLLYDPHGMLLIPQPTARTDDPLVWPKQTLRHPLMSDMGKIS
jgi:hypothetical protein